MWSGGERRSRVICFWSSFNLSSEVGRLEESRVVEHKDLKAAVVLERWVWARHWRMRCDVDWCSCATSDKAEAVSGDLG